MRLTTILDRIWNQKALPLFFILLLIIYLVNTFHTKFPDEFDNILGGLYITQGILPYTGFFSHHAPLAYFFAALITLFTQQSFVWFRLVFALVLFAGFFLSFIFLRKRLPTLDLAFFLLYGLILAIASTYFWGQMLLSETLVSYLLIPSYALLVLKGFYRQRFELWDLIIASLLTFFGLITSLTFIYVVLILDFFILFFFFQAGKTKLTLGKILLILGIFAAPYFLFLVYLFLTGSLDEFIFQTIVYNQSYYITIYPRPEGVTTVNPIRLAIFIINEFFNNYQPLLAQIRDFNFNYPFNVTLALSNVILVSYLLVSQRYSLALMTLGVVIFSTARSNPLSSAETDFHSTVYNMVSLFNASLIFFWLINHLNRAINFSLKLVFSFFLFVLITFWFFNTLFIGKKFWEKAYTKYMGTAPLIYDRPVAAPILNGILSQNDYVWIGPFEFEELFYTKARLPSKYHWLLPAHAKSEKIRSEMIADLTKNRPKVIVFKREYTIFAAPLSFNEFFVRFLDENYFRLMDLKEKERFRFIEPRKGDVDFEGHFYFDRGKKDEIIKDLFEQKIIERV